VSCGVSHDMTHALIHDIHRALIRALIYDSDHALTFAGIHDADYALIHAWNHDKNHAKILFKISKVNFPHVNSVPYYC